MIPLFIFDNVQIDTKQNKYFGEPSFAFLIESLVDLETQLKKHNAPLHVVQGIYADIVESLITKDSIDAVFVNKDYTPFARKHDGAINDVCKKHGVPFVRADDYTLAPIETLKTGNNTPYSVFTPFMKKAIEHRVPKPQENKYTHYYTSSVHTKTVSLDDYIKKDLKKSICKGGRAEALSALKRTDYLKTYKTNRDIPSQNGTSQLSPHHKFGTISIRETYYHAKQNTASEQFIAELYWRDFYLHIAYHFPHVFKGAFLPWGDAIKWQNNVEHFEAWKAGKTGIPIVDAGMRQLAHTGWMHNRVRMIVASFLAKNMLINWQWGEQYFATQLVDYDPASNNGAWQWSASVGADPRPLRIFNPYTQTQKYDPNAAYIHTWVPELQSVSVHELTDGKEKDFSQLAQEYPAPIISCKGTYHRAREVYKQAKNTYTSAAHG